MTKIEKIFIRVIQLLIFEDLQINISSENSPTLFFDVIYYTTIIYEESALYFRVLILTFEFHGITFNQLIDQTEFREFQT